MADVLRPEARPTGLGALRASVLQGASIPVGSDQILVTGIALHSGSVQPGDIYLALPGRQSHGARFATEAIEAGAVAVVTDASGELMCGELPIPVITVEHPRALSGPLSAAIYAWPARSLQILGVTGTNGKSTVTAMVESGLRAAGMSCGAIGTVGTRINGTVHGSGRTTPEAPDLQATLGAMRDAGVQSVVMEVSSIAVDEHRVDGFRFDVMGFTNMSQDHLDYHANMDAYFEAKARLFTPEHAALGVVGIDDEYGRRLSREASIPVYTWSLADPAADWHASAVRSSGPGHAVQVTGPRGETAVLHVPLPGVFNVANALCAFGMLRASGVGIDAAVAGIGRAAIPGRMQVIGKAVGLEDGARGIWGIVDYAHTPDAIARVLEAAREQASRRLIVVLGAGGDRDASKREVMGEVAAERADVIIVTDDNPRSEEPAVIRQAIVRGAERVARDRGISVLNVEDRAEAISVAVTSAHPGDIVMVLGKGHETGQEVAGVVTPFDDAVVLAAALESGGSA
ncbi:MAG: UDP-N-acetylmuramoyl-L-alanyl-D-glutamate--2,6-diaminopimelate ligase [Candidatus Nanopelagicales bacterium]